MGYLYCCHCCSKYVKQDYYILYCSKIKKNVKVYRNFVICYNCADTLT